jgi:hypothetical protein
LTFFKWSGRQDCFALYAFLIRNIRCWNASLNLLVRRFKPLAASTHKKRQQVDVFKWSGRQDCFALYAFLIRNIRCWNASLNLLVRRSKPLAASAHKKTPTS